MARAGRSGRIRLGLTARLATAASAAESSATASTAKTTATASAAKTTATVATVVLLFGRLCGLNLVDGEGPGCIGLVVTIVRDDHFNRVAPIRQRVGGRIG